MSDAADLALLARQQGQMLDDIKFIRVTVDELMTRAEYQKNVTDQVLEQVRSLKDCVADLTARLAKLEQTPG